MKRIAPQSEADLLARCCAMTGVTFGELASALSVSIPDDPLKRKGLMGAMIERMLGTDAGSNAEPDFRGLQIELKTLPIGADNRPVESTFLTSIPMLSIHRQTWETSSCYAKIKRILWVPIESDEKILFAHRRIGSAFLWSPSEADESILKEDFMTLTGMIIDGDFDALDARVGTYLQVRPKGKDAHSLCDAFDGLGNRIKTLPRGFYLRRIFTEKIWKNSI